MKPITTFFQSSPIKIGILLFMALALRFAMIPYASLDYSYYLQPWYYFIQEHGGWEALQYRFSIYSPAYLYWLVIAGTTLRSLPSLLSIKLFAIIVDFLAGFMAYKLVRDNSSLTSIKNGYILAFFLILFAPTVIVNSSLWGQCDIIYTTALLAFIYCLGREKFGWSYFYYGVAISFKLQSIFYLLY